MKSILTLILLTVTFSGYAQNPYENVKTISAEGVLLNVDYSQQCFMLSNAANKLDRDPRWYYQDGRELETLDDYKNVGAKMIQGEQRAIREALGDSVIESLRIYNYCPLVIFYVIGPDGTTLEVAFIVNLVPELLSLKPEVFAVLDRQLKKLVKWEVNKFGRKLKYFHGISFINFKKVPITSELHTIKPTDSFLTIDRSR